MPLSSSSGAEAVGQNLRRGGRRRERPQAKLLERVQLTDPHERRVAAVLETELVSAVIGRGVLRHG